eukprot:gnl/TRDRNA2_/TRDRNA2_77055_c2_seq1.p1 gnl/TRDRNA2_/TRDRNA2_77055_c2~~gnl/TRDRNA2_/TRDRNA2_77055_c2_seq1.p1  ORF type:complete len:588 (-),score=112.87 gnl/TRDRNA2_/TRDRNA2_77055_c2_seq1:311-1978(-)
MVASAEIVAFFHQVGWQMQVCSQGTVKVKGSDDSREQQILFRPGASMMGVIEPHLFMELYVGDVDTALSEKPDVTQVLGNQCIRVAPIGDCNAAIEAFHQFMLDYLGGVPGTDRYFCDIFLGRGLLDNNLGCWTMRICDFMVDRLGWSFVVCNVCNLGDFGQRREQQLVFRYDGERREIPVSKDPEIDMRNSSQLQFPPYWSIPEVMNFQKAQAVVPCTQQEVQGLQEIFDHTFRRILTRDRVYEYQATTNEEMPFRLEVVHAFRSENSFLYKRFSERCKQYTGGTPVKAKTRGAGKELNSRLNEGEALLFHGTNPSSAMGILKSGFVLRNAGKSTGTMFGHGIYLAECASKSDEYACGDSGGTYPGLNAILVCRCLIGNPMVVQEPGDYTDMAKAQNLDCVLGDRETKVNTYREFVFGDQSQVLPEYTVIYRREYDKNKVPAKLQLPAMGSTGKSWQVKLEGSWANVPPDVNQRLIQSLEVGQMQVDVTIGNFQYMFDLKARTQVNKATGVSRQIRPPYNRASTQRSSSGLGGGLSTGSSTLSLPTATSSKKLT